MPVFSILFTKMVVLFYEADVDSLSQKGIFWGCMFGVYALVAGLANFVQVWPVRVVARIPRVCLTASNSIHSSPPGPGRGLHARGRAADCSFARVALPSDLEAGNGVL